MSTLVSGSITLPESTDHFAGATVYISLEEVGMMDMPSSTLTQTIQHNVTYEGHPLQFSVEGHLGEVEGNVTLRVHISLHHSEDVKKGDFITKRSYPVLRDGSPDMVDVAVEPV